MQKLPLFLLLTGLTGLTGAGPTAMAAFPGLTPLPEAELAFQRGGFELPNGMQVSLGIESMVMINGEPVAHSTWTDGQVLRTRPGIQREGLHVGPLNSLAASGDQGLGWLVQNRLDGQLIQHVNDLHLRLDGVRGLTDPALGRMIEAQSVFQVLR